jgi:hypothetical protein
MKFRKNIFCLQYFSSLDMASTSPFIAAITKSFWFLPQIHQEKSHFGPLDGHRKTQDAPSCSRELISHDPRSRHFLNRLWAHCLISSCHRLSLNRCTATNHSYFSSFNFIYLLFKSMVDYVCLVVIFYCNFSSDLHVCAWDLHI